MAAAAAALCLAPAAGAVVRAQSRPAAPASAPKPPAPVTARASGPFEVKLAPLPAYDSADGSTLGRMSIDKQFRGDLDAVSTGEMLSAMTPVKGSAAYSAVERVRGTLAGRRGSFVLQHTGVMTRGAQHLVITVVPDSGTDELAGLAGTMAIQIEGGRHSYTFDYTLPAPGAAAP
jgi:hypothetical protein